ncbi:hypothetical protein RchiOBHm_Chr3g0457791 [Rosa chinensis]|uniref:Uncharacterized protein n=1 Tax=Rosa chinensis TaxID=74649 RepID=A0A2P6R7P2_ROSCH|nr:uncharacterized protein LOC112194085 isoform X1 [Rosa chinensis]PRQ42453.1 hypothetical protein RchiOBHm_Chr3g0457791 [Rosa chinensis]
MVIAHDRFCLLKIDGFMSSSKQITPKLGLDLPISIFFLIEALHEFSFVFNNLSCSHDHFPGCFGIDLGKILTSYLWHWSFSKVAQVTMVEAKCVKSLRVVFKEDFVIIVVTNPTNPDCNPPNQRCIIIEILQLHSLSQQVV